MRRDFSGVGGGSCGSASSAGLRAARGSTWRILGSSRQELADQNGKPALKSVARV